MTKPTLVLAVLLISVVSIPLFGRAPLQPGYQVGDRLQLFFREYLVTGPGVDQPRESNYLVCSYSTRPVVMVYTREITALVVRLIKQLDATTQNHQKERLGSYVVLLCEPLNREAELQALAKKEKIRHTTLALAVPHERFQAKFGAEAETTVILATSKRQVKASYAYRKGELKDRDIEQIIADVPKILPKTD